MPSETTRGTVARQWELLQRLPTSGPGLTTTELVLILKAAGFSVSKRQVERDLQNLSEAFPLDCNNGSIPWGWRWAKGASVDLPGLSSAEALSLKLVENAARPLLPASLLQALEPRFEQATKKLRSLDADNKANKWLSKVRSVPAYQALLPPPVRSEALTNVQEALLADEQLDVDYQGMDAEAPATLRLHPLALVVRGPVTYLVATAWDYPDVRLYALHRIHRAARAYEPSQTPEGFDLDAYIASGALQFGRGEAIRLEARITPELARILSETPLAADQFIEGDRLTATVQDTWQLRWWVMGQGAGIEVNGPPELRNEVKKFLADSHGQYVSITLEAKN